MAYSIDQLCAIFSAFLYTLKQRGNCTIQNDIFFVHGQSSIIERHNMKESTIKQFESSECVAAVITASQVRTSQWYAHVTIQSNQITACLFEDIAWIYHLFISIKVFIRPITRYILDIYFKVFFGEWNEILLKSKKLQMLLRMSITFWVWTDWFRQRFLSENLEALKTSKAYQTNLLFLLFLFFSFLLLTDLLKSQLFAF